MRHYSREEEERIRAQAQVREWARASLIDASQRARLDGELRVDLKRTNVFLRAGLAGFTGLIVAAAVLLAGEVLDLNGSGPLAAVAGLASVVCIVFADVLAGRFRFYRFGVEEALAVAAVLLLGFSASELISGRGLYLDDSPQIAALLVGTAGGFLIYFRFGFVYAAFGGMACAALIPFQTRLPPATMHALAAAILTAVFLAVRSKRLQYRDDFPGDEYGQLQAAALAGIYLTLNLQLTFDVFNRTRGLNSGAFYWLTYVVTWVLPIVGLRLAIREKDRLLLNVSVAIALVTLITNKLYLGWERQAWDPILLGVFLMAVAIGVRRWLSEGSGGERSGFTPKPLLGKDSVVLTLLQAASARFQPDVHLSGPRVPPDEPASPPDFGGGRSGGAGGGGAF
jgi:hypothetical protein